MLMIGLGEAGKNIAKLFKPHSKNYKVILLDESEGLEKKDTVEEYDSIDFKFKQRGLKSHDEAILFLCGSGKVAGASLRILEALKDYKTSVYYIIPDLEFCSREEKLRHRVHFNVIQEYTRSGMLDEMVVLDNKTILEIAGAGTVSDYYSNANFFIYNLMQNLMYCDHVKPDFSRLHNTKEISRISTISYGSFDAGDEKKLFELQNETETHYYINIEEEDLDNDTTVIPNCKQMVRDNNEKERETSFAIWKSDAESCFYGKHYTHFIQEA